MTEFSDYEALTSGARPVECYLFKQGVNQWRITSADEAVELPGIGLFLPSTIRCGEIDHSNEDGTGGISLYVPDTSPIVALFQVAHAPEPIWLKMYLAHRDDLAKNVPWWTGRISSVDSRNGESTLAGKSLLQILKLPSIGMTVGPQCPYVLYSPGCSVKQADFTTTTTLTTVSTNSVAAAAFAGHPDGYYKGGKLYPKNGPPILIVDHVGSTLTLLSGTTGIIAVGDTVKATAGCDQSSAICDTRFHNFPNTLAFDHLPGKNPFTQRVF